MKKYMKPTITVMEVEIEAAICAGSGGGEPTGSSIGNGDASPDVTPLSGWTENRSIFADDDE